MAIIQIQIPPGVIRGASPNDAPNRWWDTNLVRWNDNMLQPVGGWAKFTTVAFASAVRKLFAWRDNTGDRLIASATNDKIHILASGNWYDATPAGIVGLDAISANGYGIGPYGDDNYGVARAQVSPLYDLRSFWSFDSWGEDCLAMSSKDGRFFYFDVTTPSTDFVQLGQYSISSISRNTNVTTVVTTAAHGMTSGRSVTIAGVADNTYNGTFNVTVTNSTTFTYSNSGTNGSSSGGTALDNTIPVGCNGFLVTDERHVMAIGAGDNGRRLAWSSRESLTDWDFASVTNTAGFLDLQTDTPLLFGVRVREGVLVFSSNQVFLVRYVGMPFVYSAELLGQSAIYSIGSIATFEGKALWYDQDGFKLYANGAVQNVPCPLYEEIRMHIDAFYGPKRAFASFNGSFSEVWWFFPESGATECSRYLIYNFAEQWWSMGDLERTAMVQAGSTPLPIMAGPDFHLYEHETGRLADGATMAGMQWAETAALVGIEKAVEARQLQIATGHGYDKVTVRAYTRMTPEGAERSFGPYTPRSNGYTDIRVSGREVRFRFTAAVTGEDWSLGSFRLEAGEGGAR
jgi:hypothetical protein